MKINNFFETCNIFKTLDKIFYRNMTFRDEIYGNHLKKKVLNQIKAGEASFKPSAREKEKAIPTDSSKKIWRLKVGIEISYF